MKTSHVDDVERYWGDAPPERSPRCSEWLERIAAGWRPNRRLRQMDHYSAASFFGVYLWEYLWEVSAALRGEPLGELANITDLFEPRPVPRGVLMVESCLRPSIGTVLAHISRDLAEGLAGDIRQCLGQAFHAHSITVELQRDASGVIAGLTFTMPSPPQTKETVVL